MQVVVMRIAFLTEASCKEQASHLTVMLNDLVTLLDADPKFLCQAFLAHKSCRAAVHQLFVQTDFVA